MREVFRWHGLSLLCAVIVYVLLETVFDRDGAKFFVGWVYGSCISIIIVWALRLAFKKEKL